MNEATMTTTATPAADLEDRVATALTSDATSSEELAALVNEVDIARVEVAEAVARARDAALSPTTPKDLRKPARGDLAAAEFLAERLGAAVAQLRSAQAAARRRETAQRRLTEQEALTDARAAIVAEAAERIPELSFLLAHLCARIKAVDAKIAEFNRTARSDAVAPTGLDALLSVLKLPSWDQPAHRSIWPVPQPRDPLAGIPPAMLQEGAQKGHEARATGEAVGRMRVAEIGSPRRRIA